MFVIVAIVLTFVTTPGTLLIYPERHRSRAGEAPRRRGKRSGGEKENDATGASEGGSGGREFTTNLLVVLQKIEHLAPVMLLTQMLEPAAAPAEKPNVIVPKVKIIKKTEEGDITDESAQSTPERPSIPLSPVVDPNVVPTIHIDALKLVELTGRMFSIMQSAEKDDLLPTDDTLQLYRQFGRLRGLEVTPHISIVEQEQYPHSVTEFASDLGSELVIVPWTVPPIGNSSALIDSSPSSSSSSANGGGTSGGALTPYDNIFGADATGSPRYTHFVRRIFSEARSDVALFVDRGFGGHGAFSPGAGQHIFLPFFGGPDDRLALRFVVQLCQHTNVSATVVWIKNASGEESRASMDTVPSGKGVVSGYTGAGAGGGEAVDVAMIDSIQVHHNALASNQLTVGPAHVSLGESSLPLDTVRSRPGDLTHNRHSTPSIA